MKITLKMLDGACKPQRDLFATLFGAEVELTLDLCLKHSADFDFDWAAENLMSAPALAAYEAATAPALAAYEAATATAFFNAATMETSLRCCAKPPAGGAK